MELSFCYLLLKWTANKQMPVVVHCQDGHFDFAKPYLTIVLLDISVLSSYAYLISEWCGELWLPCIQSGSPLVSSICWGTTLQIISLWIVIIRLKVSCHSFEKCVEGISTINLGEFIVFDKRSFGLPGCIYSNWEWIIRSTKPPCFSTLKATKNSTGTGSTNVDCNIIRTRYN